MNAMTVTLSFAWWWIPVAVTLAAFLWAIFKDAYGTDTFGIGLLFRLGFASFISMAAWMIAGFFK